MTDDKGAGEGPYKAGQRLSPRDVFPLSSREASLVSYGYAAGRKAERERCSEIARGFSSCEGIAQKIAKEIEEAQDGK